jgi:hypothetical protein
VPSTSISTAPLPSPGAPGPLQHVLQQHFAAPAEGDAGQLSTDLFVSMQLELGRPVLKLETRIAKQHGLAAALTLR